MTYESNAPLPKSDDALLSPLTGERKALIQGTYIQLETMMENGIASGDAITYIDTLQPEAKSINQLILRGTDKEVSILTRTTLAGNKGIAYRLSQTPGRLGLRSEDGYFGINNEGDVIQGCIKRGGIGTRELPREESSSVPSNEVIASFQEHAATLSAVPKKQAERIRKQVAAHEAALGHPDTISYLGGIATKSGLSNLIKWAKS